MAGRLILLAGSGFALAEEFLVTGLIDVVDKDDEEELESEY